MALALVLAINRAIDLRSIYWSAKLFKGRKTWFWIGGCTVVGMGCFLFHLSPLATVAYDSEYGTLAFDPNGEPYGVVLGKSITMFMLVALPLANGFVWLAFRWRTAGVENRDLLSDKVSRTKSVRPTEPLPDREEPQLSQPHLAKP